MCSNDASVDTAKLLCKEFLESKLTKKSSRFPRLNKPLLLLFFLAVGVATAFGWKYYKERYPSWYEEVRLSDGRVVTIHQKRQYFENYGTNQSWVTIDLPELGGKQVWHSYLMPQRVDVLSGKVYVFGIPRGDRQLEYYGFPKHYMVAFIWSDGSFIRIPFLDVPESVRAEENVYPFVPLPLISKITISQKSTSWCPPRGDKGQLTRHLNLEAYTAVADEWASLYRWSNRSE